MAVLRFGPPLITSYNFGNRLTTFAAMAGRYITLVFSDGLANAGSRTGVAAALAILLSLPFLPLFSFLFLLELLLLLFA